MTRLADGIASVTRPMRQQAVGPAPPPPGVGAATMQQLEAAGLLPPLGRMLSAVGAAAVSAGPTAGA